MCGIAAVFNSEAPLDRTRRMLALLRHRGDCSDPPLAAGDKCACGTERLRIVDAPGGRQPTLSHDKQWLVAFNGEIYNHAALREEMAADDVPFHSNCDTEVLANLIAREGVNSLDKLDGMFAFVAIKTDGSRFLAARDPMGIKPLYFIRNSDTYLFATECLPLIEESPVATTVESLPSGSWMTESSQGVYWKRPARSEAPNNTNTLDENAAELDRLLVEAIRKRIPPDLPCAILFSGGIDSTLVFHIARQINPEIKGFYIGNPDGKDYKYAKLYAEQTGAQVDFLPSAIHEVLEYIPEVIRTCETFEPNQIRGGCLSYLLARHVSNQGYRVALCGEGADELFCGYPELQRSAEGNVDWRDYVESARSHFLDYLHKTQLMRVDKCSMRHKLEVRVPFLDRAILNFSETLPLTHLVEEADPKANRNKIILREVFKRYPEIPEEFYHRDKIVFTEGSGLENNGPHGPFWEYAKRTPRGEIESKHGIQIHNHEEAFYLECLEEVFPPERVLHLADRPRVNRR